jgi:hypothetical protein
MNHKEFLNKMEKITEQLSTLYNERSQLFSDYEADIKTTLITNGIDSGTPIVYCGGVHAVVRYITVCENGMIEIHASKPPKENKLFVIWRGQDINEFIKRIQKI